MKFFILPFEHNNSIYMEYSIVWYKNQTEVSYEKLENDITIFDKNK